MDVVSLLNALLANDQARILIGLVVANLVLGIVSAVSAATFDLTRLGDYARTRLLPVLAVYFVGALVTWAAPQDPLLGRTRDLVFGTESLTMIGLLAANLRDLGINLPSTVAGPTTTPAK